MRHFLTRKMTFIFFITAAMFGRSTLQAQCTDPVFPQTGLTVESFVPQGWLLKDQVKGDFNADSIPDIVLLLASNAEQSEAGFMYECHRPLLILKGTQQGYVLSASCKHAVLCKGCGGAFGDPYESISLEKNVLNINHYGGSAYRWSRNYTFRFLQNQWLLIGCSESSFWSLGECNGSVGEAGYNLDEANFNTCKAHIIRTPHQGCEPEKDQWLSFKKMPPVTFQSFDVDRSYIPPALQAR